MVNHDLTIYPLLRDFFDTGLEYWAGFGSFLLPLAIEGIFKSLIGVGISELVLIKISEAWS